MRDRLEGHHSLVPGSTYPSCDLEARELVKDLIDCFIQQMKLLFTEVESWNLPSWSLVPCLVRHLVMRMFVLWNELI